MSKATRATATIRIQAAREFMHRSCRFECWMLHSRGPSRDSSDRVCRARGSRGRARGSTALALSDRARNRDLDLAFHRTYGRWPGFFELERYDFRLSIERPRQPRATAPARSGTAPVHCCCRSGPNPTHAVAFVSVGIAAQRDLMRVTPDSGSELTLTPWGFPQPSRPRFRIERGAGWRLQAPGGRLAELIICSYAGLGAAQRDSWTHPTS